MWADLTESDFTGSTMTRTIFVEAKLRSAKLEDIKKDIVYLKFANLEGTKWAAAHE
jgi:uncharacterized protein YjbI with pentapeptide repeats